MDFSEKLKKLIKSKYVTIGDCAEKFNMNYTQLSQYLNGKKVSIDFLKKIIIEFPEADLNWLLRDTESLNMVNEDGKGYKKMLEPTEIITTIHALLDDLNEQLPQN